MSNLPFSSPLGVNYSNTFQSAPISDATAAADITSACIQTVKMFNYTQTSFFAQAAAGGFKVIPAISNDELAGLANGTSATSIVKALSPYADQIAAIMVGNEPLINAPDTYGPLLKDALNNLNDALNTASLSIKLSVPFNSGIEAIPSWPPSVGQFQPTLTTYLKDVCAFLKKTGSFFTINIYPYYAHIGNPTDVPLPYCLFTNTKPQFTDSNTNLPYYNIFDAQYDATYFALKALGYDLPLVVGECGWPTAGGMNASVDNATAFNQNLIDHIKKGKGSPAVPSSSLTTFLFEMYDEDLKNTAPGLFEKSWGWYESDGSGKYSSKYKLTW